MVSRPEEHEDDVLAAVDASDAIEGVVEGIELVGLAEGGDDEGLEGLADDLVIIGEIGEDVGAHVVGDYGDVVVGLEAAEEAVGGLLHVVDEGVGVGGELEEQDGGDGGFGKADGLDLLLNSVFDDEEVRGLEVGNEFVGLVE